MGRLRHSKDRRLRPGVGIRLAPIGLALVLFLGACSGDDEPATETPSPGTGAEETLTPEPGPTVPGADPALIGELERGRYFATRFTPTLAFLVPKGWQLAEDTETSFLLLKEPQPDDEALYFDASFADLDTGATLERLQEIIIGTTGTKGHFTFGATKPAKAAGLEGERVELKVNVPQEAVTFELGTEAYEFAPGDHLYLYALDLEGTTIVVFVEAPEARFAVFAREAEFVLASTEFFADPP